MEMICYFVLACDLIRDSGLFVPIKVPPPTGILLSSYLSESMTFMNLYDSVFSFIPETVEESGSHGPAQKENSLNRF